MERVVRGPERERDRLGRSLLVRVAWWLGSLAAFPVSESSTEPSTLVGIETSPHARSLVGAEGILEAGVHRRAFGADLLGSGSSGWFLGSREEYVAGDAVTGGVLPPVNLRLPHDVSQSQQLPRLSPCESI